MYGTLSGADDYHAERGNTTWTGFTDQQRTAALVRASDAIDALYGNRFIGVRADGANQPREWPRTGAQLDALGVTDSQTPIAVEHATYDFALVEATTPGYFNKTFDLSKQVKKVVVGPVSKEYAVSEYSDSASYAPRLLSVDGALRFLLRGSYAYPAIAVV